MCDQHLSFRLFFVNVEYFILSDHKYTRLTPTILVDLLDLVAEHQLAAAKQLDYLRLRGYLLEIVVLLLQLPVEVLQLGDVGLWFALHY